MFTESRWRRQHKMTITIIMPIYNGERFLRPAVDSVLRQSLPDFELLAVDDGSTDSSRQILETFRAEDKRLNVIYRPHLGYAATLNTAINNASRDLIAMMDADDVMMPNRLERQLSFLNSHPNASVICSYAYLIDIKGEIIGTSQNDIDVERGRAERNPKLFSEIVNPSVLMRKRDIIQVGGYRESFIFAPDRDLWGRLVTSGYSIQCQPEFLHGYRLHLGAMSGQSMKRNALFATLGDVNFVRRLRGEAEITFNEFLRQRKQRPLRQRLNDLRLWTALMYYKRATRYRGECQWIGCARSFAIAVSLAPSYVLRRTWSKFEVGAEIQR
jgi:glycosyltransferase involved in cell wall biosynthesis